jgi:hypothetical protein
MREGDGAPCVGEPGERVMKREPEGDGDGGGEKEGLDCIGGGEGALWREDVETFGSRVTLVCDDRLS